MIGDPFDTGDDSAREFGDVEANLRADLAKFTSTHPFAETLGAVARRLARSMDEDRNDKLAPLAGTAREIRQTVSEIASVGGEDDDNFESALSAPSPSPVRDSP